MRESYKTTESATNFSRAYDPDASEEDSKTDEIDFEVSKKRWWIAMSQFFLNWQQCIASICIASFTS